LLAHLLAKC
jgi:hypothetical protein